MKNSGIKYFVSEMEKSAIQNRIHLVKQDWKYWQNEQNWRHGQNWTKGQKLDNMHNVWK